MRKNLGSYYRFKCGSYRQVLEWLHKNNINKVGYLFEFNDATSTDSTCWFEGYNVYFNKAVSEKQLCDFVMRFC